MTRSPTRAAEQRHAAKIPRLLPASTYDTNRLCPAGNMPGKSYRLKVAGPRSLRVAVVGTWLEDCISLFMKSSKSGHSAAAIRDTRANGWPWRCAGIAIPFYHPSPPDEARENDARRRAASGPNAWPFFAMKQAMPSAAISCNAAGAAAAVRSVLKTLSRYTGPTGQPAVCPASSALVRAEPLDGISRNFAVWLRPFELASAMLAGRH
jgi:hypothetical protein